MKLHYVVVAWGKAYVDMLVNIALPSLLAPGNIPALSELGEGELTVYTTPEDQDAIRAAPSVQRLSKFVEVRFGNVDLSLPSRTKYGHKYRVMTHAHGQAGRRAEAAKAHAVILAPDAIFADGSLAHLRTLIQQGKRAVNVIAPRLVTETALPEFMNWQGRDEATLPIKPREFVRFAMDHLHPEILGYFIDSPNFSQHPAYCLWRMGDQGILARAFYFHPLMIDYSRIGNLQALFNDTIDGDFVGAAIGTWDRIHVETDSDNIFVCSLSPNDSPHASNKPNLATLDKVRKMAYHPTVNPLHRMFFMHAIKMHTVDLDDDWARMEEETGLWAFDALRVPAKGSRSSGGSRLPSRRPSGG